MPSTRPTSPTTTPMISALMVDARTMPPRLGVAPIVEATLALIVEAGPARRSLGGRVVRLDDPEREGYAPLELGGHVLGALRHDHPTKVDLEREPFRARGTVVEMASDRSPLP